MTARPTEPCGLDFIKKRDAPIATPSVNECIDKAIVVKKAELILRVASVDFRSWPSERRGSSLDYLATIELTNSSISNIMMNPIKIADPISLPVSCDTTSLSCE